MTQRSELGKSGEDLVCRYLVDKKFKIIERNYRKPWGELDVIAKSPDKTLVFVEVKTMRQFGNKSGNSSQGYPQFPNSEINPEMQMTQTKIKKVKRTAALYVGSYPELIDENKGWRIDLLALTINGKDCVINHYENI
jgi:putative endonuclease